ncbi:hypothetical protein CKO51_16325 [Rhodopirellula sp. SM50]|nr:hypothetical protein CKO51_16325 [Rhodopirellula sp. SM50]
MSSFDRCAVDSAEEDKPTPVDSNVGNQRLKCRPLIGMLNFPLRFRSSTLAVSDDGACRRRGWTREPCGAPPFVDSKRLCKP